MHAMQPTAQTNAPIAAICPTQPAIPAPIWASMATRPEQAWWRRGQTLNPRKNFIEDLTGVTEREFREVYRWSIGNPFNPEKTAHASGKPWALKFTDPDGQYRRAAIFHSTFALLSIQELSLPKAPITPTLILAF